VVRQKNQRAVAVYELGEEYVPDILFLPGLRQNQDIFLRRTPLAFLLWDKLSDPSATAREFGEFGLAGYGLSRAELLKRPSWQALEPALYGELQAVLWP
jgi:hypothetical protein